MIAITFSNLTRAVADTLLELYDTLTHGGVEMTGTQYIAALDNPSTGADPVPSAEAVFTAGTIDNAAAPGSAAAVFNAPAPVAVTPVMTPAATATYEAYKLAGWSDEQLIASGLMVMPAAIAGAPKPPANAAAVFDASNAPNAAAGATGTHLANSGQTSASTQGAQQVAQPNTGAHAVMLDVDGLPWDERIHSGNRTQTDKGAWKKRKNVQPGVVTSVTAELRALLAAGGGATPAPFVPLNTGSVAAPPAPSAAAPAAPPPPAALAPAPPSGAVTTASPSSADPVDFVGLVRYATSHFKAEEILKVCEENGLQGLGQVASNLHLVPKMVASFKALR